jgi:hypothetical protein
VLREFQRLARRGNDEDRATTLRTVDVACGSTFVVHQGPEHEAAIALGAGGLDSRVHHHLAYVLGVAAGERFVDPPPSVGQHDPALRPTALDGRSAVVLHRLRPVPPIPYPSLVPRSAIRAA